MRKAIIAAIIITYAIFCPETANASARPVYIQETVSGNNDTLLRHASKFVDKYTGTRFVYGTCRATSHCIKIRTGALSTPSTGLSDTRNPKVCATTIDRRGQHSVAYWQRLFEHELGHCMGIHYHSASPTNIMWAPLTYRGIVVKERFTAPQISILKKN